MCEAITDGNRVIEELAERLIGRYLCEDVVNPKTGELLVSRGRDDRPTRPQRRS